jgi:hypothetical protein
MTEGIVLPEAVRSAFEAAPFWFLATCAEGVPNVVAVGFKWIDEDTLLLADLFFDKTRRNLAANPTAAVTVAFSGPKRGFQIKGAATVHQCGAAYDRCKALLQAHGVDVELPAVVVIPATEVYVLDPGREAGKRIC